jgi:hypothetical protein
VVVIDSAIVPTVSMAIRRIVMLDDSVTGLGAFVAHLQHAIYDARMVDTVYRLIPQKDGRISVEMAKPDGRRRVIPDFVNEAEANAWIIQSKRLIRVAHPYPPGPKRKDATLSASDRRRPPT